MTDKEKQHRIDVIRSICGSYSKGKCRGDCPECLDRFLDTKPSKCTIPLKLPSLNEYIDACRSNAYKAAKMKKSVENDIMWFINKLPRFDKPVFIHYHWVEGNKRRDRDNICGGGRKFILDAMVKAGKLKDDNRNCVVGHTDTFGYEKDKWSVILEIEETDDVSS